MRTSGRRPRAAVVAVGIVILGAICLAVLLVVSGVAPPQASDSSAEGTGPCTSGDVQASVRHPSSPQKVFGPLAAPAAGFTGAAGADTAVAVRTTDPAAVPPASERRPAFGIGTVGGFASPDQWDDVARVVNESPTLVMAYASFTDPLPYADLEAVASWGATPVLTWEPWDPTEGADPARFSLSSIMAGDHDTYIREWAGGLDAYGKPVILRFAHEMNYPWYPWGAGVNGNTPEQYVAAWRHVHDLFDAQGVDNVRWAWNPQAPECGASLEPFWPGEDVVDVVALDGYNWGTSLPQERWVPPEELFGEGFRQLRELSPGTPIIIGETSSSEMGGSKAEWVRQLVAYLAEQPDVEAFIWFDHEKEQDWRIISSEASQAAFDEALRSR